MIEDIPAYVLGFNQYLEKSAEGGVWDWLMGKIDQKKRLEAAGSELEHLKGLASGEDKDYSGMFGGVRRSLDQLDRADKALSPLQTEGNKRPDQVYPDNEFTWYNPMDWYRGAKDVSQKMDRVEAGINENRDVLNAANTGIGFMKNLDRGIGGALGSVFGSGAQNVWGSMPTWGKMLTGAAGVAIPSYLGYKAIKGIFGDNQEASTNPVTQSGIQSTPQSRQPGFWRQGGRGRT